uniref:RRM domain-containing protein n=1 Tax=Esox lucius TaxID=8010 RepID=A0A6Q2Z615_ESOLU
MKYNRIVVITMKRLYIGGLSHTITQKDLRDRFGKFGDVQDVELRTRRDDEGVPYKTFGYINLEITDDGFKKCMTVLNKSKWKGGTIQIEQAKESFLEQPVTQFPPQRQTSGILGEGWGGELSHEGSCSWDGGTWP